MNASYPDLESLRNGTKNDHVYVVNAICIGMFRLELLHTQISLQNRLKNLDHFALFLRLSKDDLSGFHITNQRNNLRPIV